MPSFHILIATIGRSSLQQMLDSVLPFLTESDHVTVVFDGVEPIALNTESRGHVHIRHEPVALGFWGHGVRMAYASRLEKTDFVMHADDDDVYAPDSFDALREQCLDPNTLYIAKVYNTTRKTFVPSYPQIVNTNISTQCGIIPYELNIKGIWGFWYGGDFTFYDSIQTFAPVVFLDTVIYFYNCPWA
jgi:uncharacterized RmlC-like cupin family protein